jgi:hypothetical protein
VKHWRVFGVNLGRSESGRLLLGPVVAAAIGAEISEQVGANV